MRNINKEDNVLFLLMSLRKYFEKSNTVDLECSTRGVLFCDAVVASVIRKTYGDLSRAKIEQTLMTSYKNRCATFDNVTVTSSGNIIKDDVIVGKIGACIADNDANDDEENKYIDPKNYEIVVSLAGMWSWGSWHFPCESLCALMSKDIPHNAKIHVSQDTGYVRAWLREAGISRDRVIHGTVKTKTLIVPEQGACGSPYPEQIDWLTNISIKDTYILPIRLLILSRRNHKRAFTNFKQVYDISMKLAERLGLQLYIHDDSKLPPLKHQQQAFRNASVVIAPHGGGNVHLLAMSEGSTLVEIMDVMHVEICFLRLAVYKNINYYGVNSIRGAVDVKSLIDVCRKISYK